ncbi:MAG TPA: LysR family transcriptional regulator, partial [Myxococcota bacterium]|nr:LysR family transcriptional regulator [Myxococcota bacterium]
MDLATVDLNLLVTLHLLLEERSVRGAARRAGVSPSAMSHSLGRLRELLHDEVLVRAGHGMVATPRAELLAGPIRDLLAQARGVLLEGRAIEPGQLRRAFRLVCTDHVTTVLIPRVEAALSTQAPGVDLYVCPLVPQTMEDLRLGQVDAAIGVFPEAPPEMRTRRLFVDRFVTIARADHPRLAGAELSLSAFLAEDHLLVAPRGLISGHVDGALSSQGLQRRIARSVSDDTDRRSGIS